MVELRYYFFNMAQHAHLTILQTTYNIFMLCLIQQTMMSGLGHTSLSHAACITTAAATAPITPDVPLSPVPRYNIKFKENKIETIRGLYEHLWYWLAVRANVCYNSRDQISSNQGMKC